MLEARSIRDRGVEKGGLTKDVVADFVVCCRHEDGGGGGGTEGLDYSGEVGAEDEGEFGADEEADVAAVGVVGED